MSGRCKLKKREGFTLAESRGRVGHRGVSVCVQSSVLLFGGYPWPVQVYVSGVVVCVAILAMVFGGIITTSVQSGYRAEWAGYNLSAQALALQPIEQAKSVGEAPPPT
jgi:hypothetical protein